MVPKYRTVAVLSEHEHSSVWLAEHVQLGTKRIIKGIPRSSPYHDVLIGEAYILKNLKHPNIPEVFDLEEDSEYSYIIEEYIEGDSLGDLLKHRLLSENELFRYFLRICSIIQYLHHLPQPLIYLDIKPENIVISGEEAYLIDFGSVYRNAGEYDRVCFGNREFGVPEQLRSSAVDSSTDVYSLGKLLEYMLINSNVGAQMGKKLKLICERCCREDNRDRITSVNILIGMVENIRKKTKMGKQKAAQREKPMNVGVLGLGRRDGATHISLAVANYLASSTRKLVRLAEVGAEGDLRFFCEASGLKSADEGRTYIDKGVKYCPFGPETDDESGIVPGGKVNGVGCTVYDLGSNRGRAEKYLRYCDTVILVGPAAPWLRDEYRYVDDMSEKVKDQKRILFVNQAEERMIMDFCDFDIPTYPFPYETDPTRPGRRVTQLLKRTIG